MSLSRIPRVAVAALLLAVVVLDVLLFLQARDDTDRDRSTDAALSAAQERLPALLGYDHRSLEQDLARAKEQTTGDFHDDYARLLDEVVAPHAGKSAVTTEAEVRGAGVVSSASDEVVVLAFLTQTTTRRGATPQVSGSRVEVTMSRTGDDWKIAGLRPV